MKTQPFKKKTDYKRPWSDILDWTQPPSGSHDPGNHFISQSTLDIREKLKKTEKGPQTPIQELVKMAFKVFNAWEETAESSQQTRLQQAVNLQAQVLAAALRSWEGGQGKPTTRLYPDGAQPKSTSQAGCYKCGLNGHMARYCSKPPTRPCPIF